MLSKDLRQCSIKLNLIFILSSVIYGEETDQNKFAILRVQTSVLWRWRQPLCKLWLMHWPLSLVSSLKLFRKQNWTKSFIARSHGSVVYAMSSTDKYYKTPTTFWQRHLDASFGVSFKLRFVSKSGCKIACKQQCTNKIKCSVFKHTMIGFILTTASHNH